LPDFLLAAGAIREYVLAILRVPVKFGGRYDEPDEKVVDCFIAVVEVLGEKALPLLPPLLNSFSPDIPWLIKLLTKVKDSDVWTSPTFLPQLCTSVLDPAIDQLKPVARPGNRPAHSYPPPKPILPVRESNKGDCTVTKEELKLFIQLLKDMGLESTLDKLTGRMAQFDKFIPDAFSDVLGEEGTKELGKKRKAVEEAEQRGKKKGKVVMKDGKFVTTHE
jgi:hypothetical protein